MHRKINLCNLPPREELGSIALPALSARRALENYALQTIGQYEDQVNYPSGVWCDVVMTEM